VILGDVGPKTVCLKQFKSLHLVPIIAPGSQVAIEGNTISKTVAKHKMKKKGMAEWAMVIMLLPVMFCRTKRLNPTGGLISANSIMMMM
jgi:hypothetical protein